MARDKRRVEALQRRGVGEAANPSQTQASVSVILKPLATDPQTAMTSRWLREVTKIIFVSVRIVFILRVCVCVCRCVCVDVEVRGRHRCLSRSLPPYVLIESGSVA